MRKATAEDKKPEKEEDAGEGDILADAEESDQGEWDRHVSQPDEAVRNIVEPDQFLGDVAAVKTADEPLGAEKMTEEFQHCSPLRLPRGVDAAVKLPPPAL